MLLKAFPGELLFGRLCRTLSVQGYTPQQFAVGLHLSPRASFHPCLTVYLDNIARMCPETPEELWLRQTLFPLWAWSMPKHINELRQLKCSPAHLIRVCQLTSNNEYRGMVLRFCPACAGEDERRFGVAYWHCEHQIPGINACCRHGCRLISKPVPPRPHIAAEFYPDENHDEIPCAESELRFTCYACRTFSDLIVGHIHQEVDLMSILAVKGYLSGEGNVRKEKLFDALHEIVQDLWHIDGFSEPLNEKRLLAKLIHHSSNLFPSHKLLVQYCVESLPRLPKQKTQTYNSLPDKKGQDAILKFYRAGHSMSEISRRTGRSRCYIRGIIRREVGTDFTQAKKLTPQIEKYVITMARKGFHRRYIAQETGLSVGSIEAIISASKGLVQRRKQIREESNRRRSRYHVINWMLNHPEGRKKELKMACSRHFYWLYFNDHNWLVENLPPVVLRRPSGRVNWAKRDLELAKKVQALSEDKRFRFSLSHLDAVVGARGAIVRYGHKLPRTMQAINQYLKTRR